MNPFYRMNIISYFLSHKILQYPEFIYMNLTRNCRSHPPRVMYIMVWIDKSSDGLINELSIQNLLT